MKEFETKAQYLYYQQNITDKRIFMTNNPRRHNIFLTDFYHVKYLEIVS